MKSFKNILYVAEETIDQESAIARTVSMAENHQADLTIVDVIPTQTITSDIGLLPDESVSGDLRIAVESDHRRALESMLDPFRERWRLRQEVLVGRKYLEAIRAVLKNGYDLLIKPAENPSWTHRLFGSDDLHLLRKCPCPVWLMKLPERPNYNNVLAAVDFDLPAPLSSEQDLNREILELAASSAIADSASLHIVHAWETHAAKTMVSRGTMSSEGLARYMEREHERHRDGLYRLVEQLHGWIGGEAYDFLSPRLHLPEGPAKKVIAPLAAELRADLVVMGTVARTGISGMIIGNTAEAIFDQLACSVLAVKPPGFKTPVKLDE